MNERQRADELARAIDDLIHGTQAPRPAPADDHELKSLLRVAQSRLAASGETQAGEMLGSVWDKVVDRLEGRPQARREISQDIGADDAMNQTIVARQQMSDAILDLAERHRDEVWQRVQERVGRDKRHKRGSSGGQGATDDQRPLRARYFHTGDADPNGLLFVALDRPSLREIAEREAGGSQRQLHDRKRSDPGKNPPMYFSAMSREPSGGNWARSAFLGGMILLAAAAIGPLPSSGFAGHPIVRAIDYAGEHVGVIEAQPPASTGPQTLVTSQPLDAAQASARLGVGVVAPDSMLGMSVTSSQFFPTGLTSDGAGLFVLEYTGAGTSATVYQEASGGSDLSVPPGQAIDTTVGNVAATYFEGSWSADGGPLTWVTDGAQTLVFDHNGVRTTVEYDGPRLDLATFTAAAASLFG